MGVANAIDNTSLYSHSMFVNSLPVEKTCRSSLVALLLLSKSFFVDKFFFLDICAIAPFTYTDLGDIRAQAKCQSIGN
jgi:hypothetical protein